MTIDLIKISKIKKKSQLKKYKINKPLNNIDYLFHYMIIVNNIVGLKLTKYPVNMINSDNYNGFMLAAKYNNYIILNYLISSYPEYIYDRNNMNQTFLYFIIIDIDTNINSFINLVKNHNIDWTKLFHIYSTNHLSPLDILFHLSSFKIIKSIIELINLKYSLYQSQPALFNIFKNTKLKSSEILYILNTIYNKDSNIFTYVDDMGYNLSFPIVIYNNIKIIQYMVEKCGVTLDAYSPITTNHIFKIAYNIGVKINDYTISLYLLNNIMMNHNFNETDINTIFLK